MNNSQQAFQVRRYRSFGISLLVFVFSGCGTAQKRPMHVYDIDVGKMSGEFESHFIAESRSPKAPTILKNMQIRLLLSHGTAKVYVLESGGWEEKKPGYLQMQSLGPNAIISSIDDGRTPNGGPWVETWIVAITARTNDELLMRWVRIVNNTEAPLTDPDSKYTFDGEGVLIRTVASAEN